MYQSTERGGSRQSHVIVCGNEKGGSGKTTTCMHIIVYLLHAGYRVASIDLDVRQASLTRYIENRERTRRNTGIDLLVPTHQRGQFGLSDHVSTNENAELGVFADALANVENNHDFVVIDTPGNDNYLMRLAHSMADTLITPLNDSYVDFDVLGKVDPDSGEVREISHYANMVREARRRRRRVDNGLLDWIVMRNRMAQLRSRNQHSVQESLESLSIQLGCRLASGISERVVFRELFPLGLTVLDEANQKALGIKPTLSHLSARQEIRQLIHVLKLPIDVAGRKRAQARRTWIENASKPIELADIFSD